MPRPERARGAALLDIGARSVALRRGEGPQDARTQAVAEPFDAQAIGAAVASLAAQEPAARLSAYLSAGLARILVLSWVDQLISEPRWTNYAASRFEQTFGEEPMDWDLHVARDLPGRDRIAVAWPMALRERLRAIPNLRSVRIGLLEHLDTLLSHSPRFSGVLAEVHDDGAGLVLVAGGVVRRARWRRFGHADDLATAMRSEWATLGDFPGAQAPALAVVPPAPEPDTALAQAVSVLARSIGAREIFALPDRRFGKGSGP